MDDKAYFVDVKKTIPFLVAILDKFKGNSYMSLEGNLSTVDLSELENTSGSETSLLPRNTYSPIQDFIIFPLSPRNIEKFEAKLPRIGIRKNVIHIQIESAGKRVFGSYDQFWKDVTWVLPCIQEEFLKNLKKNNIIGKYDLDEISFVDTNLEMRKMFIYEITSIIKNYLVASTSSLHPNRRRQPSGRS
jgi:hypothetical protein